jgi:LPXTG-motif cell wall-anchored protein
MASEVLDFHHRGQLPIAADSSFDKGESCDAGAAQPAGTDGWHFVVPKNGTFDTISVTFDMDGDLATTHDVETLTEPVQHPDASHAYFYTDPGALLLDATATGQGETFNLSHTCAADEPTPVDPTPITPELPPVEPTPVDPTPITPELPPVEPTPVDPTPITPELPPVTPETPAPVEPQPEPKPEPTPVPTPEPEQPEQPESYNPPAEQPATDDTDVDDTEESADDDVAVAGTEELAHTGGSLTAAFIGAGLLAGGAGLVIAGRRRRV